MCFAKREPLKQERHQWIKNNRTEPGSFFTTGYSKVAVLMFVFIWGLVASHCFFMFLSYLISYCRIWKFLSGIVITSLMRWGCLCFFSWFVMCVLPCFSLLTLPLGVIGRHVLWLWLFLDIFLYLGLLNLFKNSKILEFVQERLCKMLYWVCSRIVM